MKPTYKQEQHGHGGTELYQVIFNSGLIGFIIWLLLFAVSTATLALIIRCAWSLREAVFLGNELQYYQPSEKIIQYIR